MSSSPSEPQPAATKVSVGQWLLSAAALTVVLGLIAALLPARARLIGLFGPAEGALLCRLLAESQRRLGVASNRVLILTALLCGVAAFALTSTMWWRQFAASVRDEYRVPPPDLFAQQLSSSPSNGQPPTAEQLRDAKLLREAFEADTSRATELDARCSYSGYFVFRVYGISNAERIREKQLLATIFWACELIAAGAVCCALMFRRNWSNDYTRAPPCPAETAESYEGLSVKGTERLG